jgi:hypothetical protein
VALLREVLPGYRREVFERWGYEDGRGWFIAERLVKIQGPSDTRPVNVDLHALETHATLLAIFSARASPMSLESLRSLQARIREAKGADRELEVERVAKS